MSPQYFDVGDEVVCTSVPVEYKRLDMDSLVESPVVGHSYIVGDTAGMVRQIISIAGYEGMWYADAFRKKITNE